MEQKNGGDEKSPLFIQRKVRDIVQNLVDEAITENDKLFLIELKISPDQSITVIVDGDEGITLKECMRISRHVEHNLDRESTDFSLEVTSPGLTEPLVNRRQYQKNLGRTLDIRTEGKKIVGQLIQVNDNTITLSWKVREPKPIGKGKVTVKKEATVKYVDIEQAKVKLKF